MHLVEFIVKNSAAIAGGIVALLSMLGAISAAIRVKRGCPGCAKSKLIALQMNEVDNVLEIFSRKMIAKYSALLQSGPHQGTITELREFRRYEANIAHLCFVLQERFRAFMRLNGLSNMSDAEFREYQKKRMEVILSAITSFFNRWYTEQTPDGVAVFQSHNELWPELEKIFNALLEKCRDFALEGRDAANRQGSA